MSVTKKRRSRIGTFLLGALALGACSDVTAPAAAPEGEAAAALLSQACNYNIVTPRATKVDAYNWQVWGAVDLGPSGCGSGSTHYVYLASRSEYTGGNWRYEWGTSNVGPLPAARYFSQSSYIDCRRFTSNPVIASAFRLNSGATIRGTGTLTIPCR